jgi:hypothetical protein
LELAVQKPDRLFKKPRWVNLRLSGKGKIMDIQSPKYHINNDMVPQPIPQKPRRKKLTLSAKILGLFIVAVVAVVVTYFADPDLIYTLGTQTNVATTPQSGYGYATSLMGLSGSDLDQRMADMKTTGVTWVRFDVSWKVVQPTANGGYNWSSYDAMVQSANSHGLKVLMIVDFVPDWAAAKGCDNTASLCAPADPIQYAQFAGATAKHFKSDGVNDFEIWNEPNITFRFEPASNPALYTRMLKDSYAAIKRVDSKDVILTAGLSPSETSDSNYSPLAFLTALYANGAHGWFDAVGAHPYTYPGDPDQYQSDDAWGEMVAEHALMAAHGDGKKQIWITEFGAPTNGPDSANYVSESDQAQIATDSVNLFKSYSWAGPMFWYNYTDTGTSTSTNENFFGLVRSDGSQKPAYAAFEQAISGN